MEPTPSYHLWQKVMEMVLSRLCYCLMLLHVYSFDQTVYNPDLLPAIKNIMHVKQLLRFCSVKFHFHWKNFKLNCSVLQLSL
jgi:hypothetical protein